MSYISATNREKRKSSGRCSQYFHPPGHPGLDENCHSSTYGRAYFFRPKEINTTRWVDTLFFFFLFQYLIWADFFSLVWSKKWSGPQIFFLYSNFIFLFFQVTTSCKRVGIFESYTKSSTQFRLNPTGRNTITPIRLKFILTLMNCYCSPL